MNLQKTSIIESFLAVSLGAMFGVLFIKFQGPFFILFLSSLIITLVYCKTTILKNESIFICIFWFIYALVSTVLEGITIVGGTFYPLYGLMVINCIFTFIKMEKSFREKFFKVGMVWFLFLFVFALGIFTASYIPQENIFKKLFIYLLPLITLLQLPSKNSNNILILFQKIVSVILILWILTFSIFVGGFQNRGGVEVNQNVASTILAVGLLAIIFGLFSTKDKDKKLYGLYGFNIITIFSGIYCLLILGSRGIAIAFALSSIFLVYKFKNSINLTKIFLKFVPLCTLILFFLPGSNNLFVRFSGEGIGTFNGRLPIWIGTIENFSRSTIFEMLFGKGVGSSRFIVHRVNPMLESAHNGYIQFFIEYGALGTLVLLTTFFIGYYSNSKWKNSLCPFGGALILFLFLINMSATQDSFVFWICLGQVLAIGGIEDVATS